MRWFNVMMLAFVLAMCLAHPVRAEVITVYGTGVNSSGTLLPDGAIDPHYTLIQYPGQVGSTPASAFALGGISFSYIVTGDASRWISWSPTWINATPSGVWVYRTTVDLTNFLPGTATITGRFASDDDATIFLNGVNTGIVSRFNDRFTDFSLSSGLVNGVNTIDFRVVNAPFVSFNPSALRVEMSGTAAAVPEPSAMVLSLVGVVGLRFVRKLVSRSQVGGLQRRTSRCT